MASLVTAYTTHYTYHPRNYSSRPKKIDDPGTSEAIGRGMGSGMETGSHLLTTPMMYISLTCVNSIAQIRARKAGGIAY